MKATIINSIEEPMIDTTLKISDDLNNEGIETNTFYLESLTFKNFKSTDKTMGEYIYFLTNNDDTGIIADILCNEGKHVINYGFINKKHSKIDIQFILSSNGINIPENYFSLKPAVLSRIKKNIKFPIILKSFKHLGKTSVFNSYSELFSFLGSSKNLKTNYFFEFYIKNKPTLKAYVVGKNVYFKNKKLLNSFKKEELIKKIKMVGKIFSLEIYSLDIIIDKGNPVFLDVNPSPAFSGNKEAYNDFIKYIKNGVKNGKNK